jgi:hypothetical protein
MNRSNSSSSSVCIGSWSQCTILESLRLSLSPSSFFSVRAKRANSKSPEGAKDNSPGQAKRRPGDDVPYNYSLPPSDGGRVAEGRERGTMDAGAKRKRVFDE